MDLNKIISNAKRQAIINMNADDRIKELDTKLDKYHFTSAEKIAFYKKVVQATNRQIEKIKEEG